MNVLDIEINKCQAEGFQENVFRLMLVYTKNTNIFIIYI